jgi:hypothetical protein
MALETSCTGQQCFNFPAEMPLLPWYEQGIGKKAKVPPWRSLRFCYKLKLFVLLLF